MDRQTYSGSERVLDGNTLVDDEATGLFERLDDLLGISARCLDDGDALFDDGLDIGPVVRGGQGGQKSEVDAEGLVGQRSALLNLLPQCLGAWLCESSDDAKASCVGDGGS